MSFWGCLIKNSDYLSLDNKKQQDKKRNMCYNFFEDKKEGVEGNVF